MCSYCGLSQRELRGNIGVKLARVRVNFHTDTHIPFLGREADEV